MLFLLFQLGDDRYAIEASRVVEVLPLLSLKRLPQGPENVAGIFNYRGQPVPAVDLSQLTLGRPASERLSTRIIVVRHPDSAGHDRLLGLVAENTTETLRADPQDFIATGVKSGNAPYLGPLLMDPHGPIQWVQTRLLLPKPIRELVFSAVAAQA